MRTTFISLLSLFFLTSCQENDNLIKIQGFAQGTTYTIQYIDNNVIKKDRLKILIDKELSRIDKLISNYRDDSNIEIFNQNKVTNKSINIDPEITSLLNISKDVYDKSKHCYDPTIKPLFNMWGFLENKFNSPSNDQLKKVLKEIGFDKIKFTDGKVIKHTPSITIDLSAIGQGYSIHTLSKIFNQYKINNYIIEVGGEMLVSGKKPDSNWNIAIERPIPNSSQYSNIVTTKGKKAIAIMTSGTYRHYFDKDGKRFSHILDPRSGKPVNHNTVLTTVLLPDPSYADAWSTALLCLGDKKGLEIANKNNIPAIFISIDENNNLIERRSNLIGNSQAWEIR